MPVYAGLCCPAVIATRMTAAMSRQCLMTMRPSDFCSVDSILLFAILCLKRTNDYKLPDVKR
jgi:hypothetical protein